MTDLQTPTSLINSLNKSSFSSSDSTEQLHPHVWRQLFQLNKILICIGLGHSKSRRTSKLQYQFKSFLTERVDFAYQGSCIGKCLRAASVAGWFIIGLVFLTN